MQNTIFYVVGIRGKTTLTYIQGQSLLLELDLQLYLSTDVTTLSSSIECLKLQVFSLFLDYTIKAIYIVIATDY